MQFLGTNDKEYFDFCCGKAIEPETKGPILIIKTLEGDMCCSMYDYIIKGVNGEFYPCKLDIFEKTYEKVEI